MIKSVANNHFPRVIAQNNHFRLYNPILKKRYENRPEERVRLKWVEYLILQADWKKTRIGFETPVKHQQSKNTLRADLVLYSDSMQPSILIECKSNAVQLNQSTAEQAAKYNSEVNANYVVLTNGVEDLWFEKSGKAIDQTSNILHQRTPFSALERDTRYWQQRGFCSPQSTTELKSWVTHSLNLLWSDEVPALKQYLDFQTSVLPVPMNQYYKLFEFDSGQRLAISFLGTETSESFVIGILNSGGVNTGIVSINLDKLQSGDQNSVAVFKEGKRRSISPERSLGLTFSDFEYVQIKNLPKTMMKFFD